MHIVFANQYYPPDVAPTGVMLEAVATELARCGHAVTVLAATGGYGGSGDGVEKTGGEAGVRVKRMKALSFGRASKLAKLLDYASYYVAMVPRLLMVGPRPDVMVALTTPPFLSVLVRVASWLRGARHAHWVMDVYPDVMLGHGMIREGGMVHRMLRGVARFGFGGRRSVAVLGLGPDMAEKLAAYCGAGRKAEWVALWETAGRTAGDGEMETLRKARGWGDGETVFLYSGNMGLGHCFGDVIAAGRRLSGEGVRLAFFGRGGRRREVEMAVKEGEWENAVPTLGDYVAQGDLPAHLASGDVHLASLDPRWDGTMVPSKLQGIFFSGRPVLFTGSASCSIGRWILESGAGWVCAPGDAEAHVAAMREALDPGVRTRMGAAARAYAERHFNRTVNAARVAAVLTGVNPELSRNLCYPQPDQESKHPVRKVSSISGISSWFAETSSCNCIKRSRPRRRMK